MIALFTDQALNDSQLFESLDRFSSHYPMAMGGFLPAADRARLAAEEVARNKSRPLWASEDWTLSVDNAEWDGAQELGEMLNRNVVQGGITCSIIWNVRTQTIQPFVCDLWVMF